MAFYTTPEQFYSSMQMVFDRVRLKAPQALETLATTGMVIRLRVTDPQAEFTADGQKRPVRVTFGPATEVQPDLDVEMNADVLHGILTHEISLKKTLSNGQVKVTGAIWRIFPLVIFLEEVRALYLEVLRDRGMV